MRDTQIEMEQTFHESYIRKQIAEEIEFDDPDRLLSRMEQCIRTYRSKTGEYYASKAKRVADITLSADEISLYIAIAVLMSTEMRPIQAVIGQFAYKLGLDRLSGVKCGGELLAVCEEVGLFTLYHADDYRNKTGTLALKANYSVSKELRHKLQNVLYLPPMVVKPKKWHNNTGGGYLTFTDSVILGKDKHHNEYQALDAINILQGIAMSVDQYIYSFVEQPNKELDPDAQAMFEIYRNQTVEIVEYLLDNGNRFFFVWKNDDRGRMYSQGYHINLQGTEYKKALLNFTKKEHIA